MIPREAEIYQTIGTFQSLFSAMCKKSHCVTLNIYESVIVGQSHDKSLFSV